MDKKVIILKQEIVFKKFIFQIEEAVFRHEKYDGSMSEPMTRLDFVRGDSASILLHHEANDTLILTEQFRYPAHKKGSGWIIEALAGTIEVGEKSTVTIRRELYEEIGFDVRSMQKLYTFFVSPGGTSERIHLYYAKVSPRNKVANNTGLPEEGEDIRMVTLSFAEALQKVESGEIQDAKTIIAIQWLQLQKIKQKIGAG